MNSQFKKGVVEMCVLQILFAYDTYGYEIVGKMSQYIETNENTIYPILHRLTRDGYLSSYYVKPTDGPKRKYYKITEDGKERLLASKDDWFGFVKSVEDLITGVSING